MEDMDSADLEPGDLGGFEPNDTDSSQVRYRSVVEDILPPTDEVAEFNLLQTIQGQEHLLYMDSRDGFVAGQWAHTEEQKLFYRDTLKAVPMVMDWVMNGYRVPMDSWPPHPLSAPNNKSARIRPDFVTEQIIELLACGVIREAPSKPWVINPFSAVYSNNIIS